MEGVDSSIYGDLKTPQPINLLGMGATAANMANSMNQARMFNLQLQSREAMAGLAQQAMGPDGQIDYNKFASSLYQDPRTSLFAPQTVTSLYQQRLLNMETTTRYIEQRQTMFDHAMGILEPALAKGTNITQKDAIGMLSEGMGLGLYDMNTAAQIITNLPQDQTNPQTGSVSNPTLFQSLKSMMATTNAGRAALDKFAGDWQTITTPGGLGQYGGFVSKVTGGFQPTQYIGSNAPTDVVDTSGGVTVMPQSQAHSPGMAPIGPSAIQPMGDQGAQPQPVGGPAPGVAPGQIQTGPLAPLAQPTAEQAGLAPPGNNPGNLRPEGASTGFQSFPTIGAGVDALAHNLDAYQRQGWTSVKDIVGHWAPPSENDTPRLIAQAAQRLGVSPDAKLDLSDPNTKAKVALAIMQQESPLKMAEGGGTQSQGVAPAAQPQGYIKSLPPQAADYLAGKGPVADYQQGLIQQREQDRQLNYILGEMHHAMEDFTAGRGATARLEAARVLKALGLDDQASAIMGSKSDGTAAALEFQKLAAPQAIQQMTQNLGGGGGSHPNKMLESVFLSTNPNLETDPRATEKIFNFYNHVMDLHNRESKAFNIWVQNKQQGGWQGGLPLQEFTQAWQDQLQKRGIINFNATNDQK